MSWQAFLDTIPDEHIYQINEGIGIVDLAVQLGMGKSRGEVKRLIEQGGIQICPVYRGFEWKDFPSDWFKVTADLTLEGLPLPGILIRKSRRLIRWLQIKESSLE